MPGWPPRCTARPSPSDTSSRHIRKACSCLSPPSATRPATTSSRPARSAPHAAQKPDITPTDFSIVNEPGASSYPICGYSWALVYTHQPSQATGQALVSLLDWLTHSGQAYAAATSYVPLPPRIQQLARTMLQQVTGPTGAHLLS